MITKKSAVRIYSICILILNPLMASAEVIIGEKVKSEISSIVAKPANVYALDSGKNEIIFRSIDEWIASRENWSEKKTVSSKEGKVLFHRIEVRKNNPVGASDKMPEGIKPTSPLFGIIHQQEPDKRGFYKELSVPTSVKLSKERLEQIGRGFIEKNGFCLQTEADKISKGQFIALQRERIDEAGSLTDKTCVYQGVIFAREIDGLEVFNSRQVVCIHPGSEEILSYRTIRWTPVLPGSRKTEYFKTDEIIESIKKHYKTSPLCEVKEVKQGLYLKDGSVFPAVRITVNNLTEEKRTDRMDKVIILPLSREFKANLNETLKSNEPDDLDEPDDIE